MDWCEILKGLYQRNKITKDRLLIAVQKELITMEEYNTIVQE